MGRLGLDWVSTENFLRYIHTAIGKMLEDYDRTAEVLKKWDSMKERVLELKEENKKLRERCRSLQK